MAKTNIWFVEVTTKEDYALKPNFTFYGKTSNLEMYLIKTYLDYIEDIKAYREPKEGIYYYDVDSDPHMRNFNG